MFVWLNKRVSGNSRVSPNSPRMRKLSPQRGRSCAALGETAMYSALVGAFILLSIGILMADGGSLAERTASAYAYANFSRTRSNA
jgi:hypothetical protein